MANIRNSISLTDRMTPTLRSILKAMDSTLRVMRDLDRASNNGAQSKAYRRAEKDLKRANNQLIKMGNYNQMVARTARDGERAYHSMGSAVQGVTNNMRSLNNTSSMFLQSLASGVYLAQKLANAVSGVMDTADTARSQVARLGLYNTSEYTNEQLYGQVFRTSMDSRSGVTETADLANKILISGVYEGEGAAQAAIETADIINRALVAGGGTSEENQRAIRQLTQGLASGVLQGDELRSIREQAPYFAEVLARGLSQIDEEFKDIGIGDLKRLGAEGELTSDRVIEAMWAMQDEINKDFEAMPRTFGQAVTSLQNIWSYFLWTLSQEGGPLERINQLLWQLVDYLQTPQGMELLEAIAGGISLIVSVIEIMIRAFGSFVTFLQENAPIAEALFVALGVTATAAAVKATVAWLAAAWPILLVIGALALVIYLFLEAGYTVEQVVGTIAGIITTVLAVIWDLVLGLGVTIIWIIATVVTVLAGAGSSIILIIMGIIQLVLWAVATVVNAIDLIAVSVEAVVKLIWGIVKSIVGGIVDVVLGAVSVILDGVAAVASAFDWVFGTELEAGVNSSIEWIETKRQEIQDSTSMDNTLAEIGQLYSDFGERAAERYADPNSMFNITDDIQTTASDMQDMISGIWNAAEVGSNYLMDMGISGEDAWNAGYEFGEGIVDEFQGLGFDLPAYDIPFDPTTGLQIDGGMLDSIGSIDSDVDISEEDLQLLRDMAARDYLLQLQSVTPVANVTFGDVRETADVNKIMDVIETMVEEQLATSLVG